MGKADKNVDEKLIEHIADLARLKLTDEEKKRFIPELKEIITLFDELSKLDLSDVEPSFQPIKIMDAVREDKIGECLTQEEALSNSSHKKDGYFKGPRAI